MGMIPAASDNYVDITTAFSKHAYYQYFIFSTKIFLIATIHVVPRHLDLATRETCCKSWSILLLKAMLK